MEKLIDAGRIINTMGVKGAVKIEPWADSPDFLLQFGTFYVDGVPCRVVSSRVHTRFVLIRFAGVDTVEDAMLRSGITISRVHLGEPKEQWYESYAFYPKNGYCAYEPRYMMKQL